MKELKALALEAGKKINEIYQKDFSVQEKEEATRTSPLTEADIEANNIIVKGLRGLSNHPILTEEEEDSKERLNSDYVWIVDPLDGTKEFVKRLGEFTVNIALVYKGRPIKGVVYAPVRDELYSAEEGKGSFLWDNRITVSDRTSEIRLVKSRSHPNDELTRFIERIHPAEIYTSGSSIKGCLVAKGEAEVYARFGPVSEWDICAMDAILTYAGGKITYLNHEPIMYNNDDILIKGFYATNGRIHIPEQKP